jgi:putative ABC transport system substrate-binding protein
MSIRLRRRDFIAGLGGAVAWPLVARAQQQQAMPVIGFLSGVTDQSAAIQAAFRKGLAEMGYVEGRNVTIDVRSATRVDQLLPLAAELVQRRVAVLVAADNATTALAAKAATATIPIVFANGADPVRLGLVASLARPGGNTTGVSFFVGPLVAKRLEMLRELVPDASTIGFLTNPGNLISSGDTSDLLAAARSIGQRIIVLNASTVEEIDAAFATAAREDVKALLIDAAGLLFGSQTDRIVALAARHRIPTSYTNRNWVEAGGLMSYSDDRAESQRQAGVYVGRILKGDKPGDLPVLQPVKFDFAINLRTAKALGIEFPPSFRLRADVVIE